MKLWVDDERSLHKDYDFHVENYGDAILVLEEYEVTHISLDHDLGGEKTGYDIACWIEKEATRGLPRIEWNLHTANPVGRKRMQAALEMADRYWRAAESMCKQHEAYGDICAIVGEEQALKWYVRRDPEHGELTIAQMLLNGDKQAVEVLVRDLKKRVKPCK